MESFLRSLMALSFVTVNALFGAAIGLPLHSANAKDCFNFGAGAANVERPLNYIRNRRDGLALLWQILTGTGFPNQFFCDIAAGVRFGCVLADAGYGLSAPFRQGFTARKLAGAVGIPRHFKVSPADVRMIWPVAKRGRPRQRHVPDILSIPAEDMLADAKWRTISWRTGTKGKLKAR